MTVKMRKLRRFWEWRCY